MISEPPTDVVNFFFFLVNGQYRLEQPKFIEIDRQTDNHLPTRAVRNCYIIYSSAILCFIFYRMSHKLSRSRVETHIMYADKSEKY